MFRLGLLWRAKRVLRLDFADERADYDEAVRDAIKADLNLPIISAAGPMLYRPQVVVPDANRGV